MEIVNKTYFVYSVDKEKNKIVEFFYYDNKESAMDMAYRLKKYPSNVFICEGLTYEYDEE
jgi:hypothetical protein